MCRFKLSSIKQPSRCLIFQYLIVVVIEAEIKYIYSSSIWVSVSTLIYCYSIRFSIVFVLVSSSRSSPHDILLICIGLLLIYNSIYIGYQIYTNSLFYFNTQAYIVTL